jgi:hypothetical protein
MVYIKVNGRYKTLKEISQETQVSLKLIQGRYQQGIRDLASLTEPKWESLKK